MVAPSVLGLSVQSGADLTEAAGAKRAALRPSGPLSAPLQESDEFGITLQIQAIWILTASQTKFASASASLVVVGQLGP